LLSRGEIRNLNYSSQRRVETISGAAGGGAQHLVRWAPGRRRRRPGGAGQVTGPRAEPSHPPTHPSRRRQHVDTDGACSERHVEVPRPEGCNRALREWPQGRAARLPDSRSALAHRKIPPRAHRAAGKIMQIHTQPSRFDCFSLSLSLSPFLARPDLQIR